MNTFHLIFNRKEKEEPLGMNKYIVFIHDDVWEGHIRIIGQFDSKKEAEDFADIMNKLDTEGIKYQVKEM